MSRQCKRVKSSRPPNQPTTPAEDLLLEMVNEDGDLNVSSSESITADCDEVPTLEAEAGPSTSNPSRKLKKKNFTDPEMDILVDSVLEYWETLFSRKNDPQPASLKSSIWSEIMMRVNTVGIDKRTVGELKKKWNDMRSKVKSKMATISRESRKTGGGAPSSVSLSVTEEKVASTYTREQVEGIGTADVCEMSLLNAETNATPQENITETEDPSNVTQPSSEQPRMLPGETFTATPTTRSTNVCHTQTTPGTLIPSLGLSAEQFTFFSDYTKENIQFMRNVDHRLECVEQHLATIASSLSNVANMWHQKNCLSQANLTDTKSNASLNNDDKHGFFFPDFGSGTEISIGSIHTPSPAKYSLEGSVHSKQSTPLSCVTYDLSPLHKPPSRPSLSDAPIQLANDGQSTSQVTINPMQSSIPQPEPSPAGNFLMNIKQELCEKVLKPCKGKKGRKRRKLN